MRLHATKLETVSTVPHYFITLHYTILHCNFETNYSWFFQLWFFQLCDVLHVQSLAASSAFAATVPALQRDAARSANQRDTKPVIPTVNCVELLNCGAAALHDKSCKLKVGAVYV